MRRSVVLALLASLVAVVVPAPSPAQSAPGPGLKVNVARDRTAISPLIYGMNFAPKGLATELDLPLDRWGGNSTDNYNWVSGFHNTGQDYYHENIPDCWDNAHNYCGDAGSASFRSYRAFVQKDRAVGADSLITLPAVGRVARSDSPRAHPLMCAFTAAEYPTQSSFDPYDPNCGSGLDDTDQPINGDDPDEFSEVIDVDAYAGLWVDDLVGLYGTAANGGVRFYELGNEPGLWHQTHRAMHAAPMDADELWTKSRDMAVAVKTADPSADVVGFSEWGWPNYFCTPADGAPEQSCEPSDPDWVNHGNEPVVEWLLEQFKDHDATFGSRTLDYIDLHYYPQGNYSPPLSITRALWDPSFHDPSWIDDEIYLLRRMKAWIAENYPGTRIALTEYNFEQSQSARTKVLAQADALGLFAREGVGMAAWWDLPASNGRLFDAWRLYRNYNGKGAKFGGTWVRASSGNRNKLAVYASQRRGDKAVTIVVINKTGRRLKSRLSLAGFRPAARAKVWRWVGSGLKSAPAVDATRTGFTTTYPGLSMTMIELRKRR